MSPGRLQQGSPRVDKISKNLGALGEIWVGDVMKTNPICVNSKESIDVAAGLLSDNNIRHLPVVDSDGNLQGILSDRDLLGAVMKTRPWILQDRLDNSWTQHRVREFMTKTPETVTADVDLTEAGNRMLENKISCLPVVEGNRVVGIITESDFVRLICEGL